MLRVLNKALLQHPARSHQAEQEQAAGEDRAQLTAC